MPRRLSVPAPDELFRPTAVPDPEPDPEPDQDPAPDRERTVPAAGDPQVSSPPRAASGRVKHEEKMTVYVTSEELIDLEDARLELRRTHRLAVDRGRLVRAAVALALADLEERGAQSALVARLQDA